METIKNRSEFLFLYDIKDANPNGDPLDENKPRIDDETGQVIVTDVRLKRTIRDYLHTAKGEDIFILESRDEEGNLRTKDDRSGDFNDDPQLILDKCIDMRLFGATTAIKGKTITWTGPVQFKYGRSLHKVNGPVLVKGTTVMPASEGKKQGTFREEWVVPYALIAFYGVANEYAAETTQLMENDLQLMTEAMWNGTKDLITRSKFGQMPRLLLRIIYKEKTDFYIGELDRLITWKSNNDIREEQIRDITDGQLMVDELINALVKHEELIEKVHLKIQERLVTKPDLLTTLRDQLGDNKIDEIELP